MSFRIYLKERLKRKKDIALFFNGNDSVFKTGGKNYTLLCLKNKYPYSRFAVSVKKSKDNNAANRNRSKRIVREIFRKNKAFIAKGFDYFIIVKKIDILSFQSSENELMLLFKKVLK